MLHTGLSEFAQNISQIVPLSDYNPRKRRMPKHFDPPRYTTSDRLIKAQCEIERLHIELSSRDNDIRQWIDRCKTKYRCLNDEIEFLETGLNYGVWENRIQMRLRISRLKGAQDYQGSKARRVTFKQLVKEILPLFW